MCWAGCFIGLAVGLALAGAAWGLVSSHRALKAEDAARGEMIPDLEALAERGERPTEDTSGRAA